MNREAGSTEATLVNREVEEIPSTSTPNENLKMECLEEGMAWGRQVVTG